MLKKRLPSLHFTSYQWPPGLPQPSQCKYSSSRCAEFSIHRQVTAVDDVAAVVADAVRLKPSPVVCTTVVTSPVWLSPTTCTGAGGEGPSARASAGDKAMTHVAIVSHALSTSS